MDKIRIRGNRPLSGKIMIGGAKNAALPLMAASLLTAETLVLTKRAVEKHVNSIFSKLGLTGADDVSCRVKAALIYLSEMGQNS